MAVDIAVIHSEGSERYTDEHSSPIGVILNSRNLGNSMIGPEYLLHFPNGRKSWVPQKLCEVMKADENLDLLAEQNLALSEDGSYLVFMSDPDDEEAEESDPTADDSDAAGSEENEQKNEDATGDSNGEEGSESDQNSGS